MDDYNTTLPGALGLRQNPALFRSRQVELDRSGFFVVHGPGQVHHLCHRYHLNQLSTQGRSCQPKQGECSLVDQGDLPPFIQGEDRLAHALQHCLKTVALL